MPVQTPDCLSIPVPTCMFSYQVCIIRTLLAATQVSASSLFQPLWKFPFILLILMFSPELIRALTQASFTHLLLNYCLNLFHWSHMQLHSGTLFHTCLGNAGGSNTTRQLPWDSAEEEDMFAQRKTSCVIFTNMRSSFCSSKTFFFWVSVLETKCWKQHK